MIARLLTSFAGIRVLPLLGHVLLLVLTLLASELSELELLDTLRRRERTISLSRTRPVYTVESSSYTLSDLRAGGPYCSLSTYRGIVGFRSNVSKLLCLLS